MENISATKFENKAESPRVIVSLTTYPGRIDRVHITIESLLRQTTPADMIVLWLATEQFPGGEETLPSQLLEQRARGLQIEWCDDIKSYKKIIPSLEKWPNDIIITADDDLIYELDAIERLLASYSRHPQCVSTLRTHLMLFDETGYPLPYDDWKLEYSSFIDQPLMALFPTTGAGTLFPPGILPEETLNRESFMTLCPKADDVWIKCMLTLAGVPVVLADTNTKLQCVDGTQGESLYAHNRTGNNEQLRAVIDKYNPVGGEEYPDDTLLIRMNDLSDYTPSDDLCQKYRKGRSFVNEKLGVKVSVILVVEKAERSLKRCLKSVADQSISDIEIICVDNGSTDKSAEILREFAQQDSRAKIITLPQRVSQTTARRNAVMESRGEYCLFPEASGMLAPDACEQLYIRAEESDADILAFSTGRLEPHSGQVTPVFKGNTGRLRNKLIIQSEFGTNVSAEERLTSCIFGGRITRKAYHHAMEQPLDGDIYDYFLLCRCAEVYVGEETPIYYAATPSENISSAERADQLKAIDKFIEFASLDELFGETVISLRRRLVREDLDAFLAAPQNERSKRFDEITSAWDAPLVADGLVSLWQEKGDRVLRELKGHPSLDVERSAVNNIGIAVVDSGSAREMFTMTELMDCVAVNRRTVLIGAGRNDTAGAVTSARADYAGADLMSEEAEDSLVFARCFEEVVEQEQLDAVILWTGSRRFVQMAIHARLKGVAVIAAMTEPVYTSMMSCARPDAGLSALGLATVVVTDSPSQQRVMDLLGVAVRYIPRPALRLMGGRNTGRAAANTILWTGEADSTHSRMYDALEIFRQVRRSIPDARMLMYIDGADDLEQLGEDMPEGVTVRRLRPDYGIFSDAAVHLVTGVPGMISGALRAGRTLGIPGVMYHLDGEQDSGGGMITVAVGDCASAAAETIRLLGAQAKLSTGAADRSDVAGRWSGLLDELPAIGRRTAGMPGDQLGSALHAAVTGYEDGALCNARRLQEFELRCEQYEQQLAQAEERRIKETEALNNVINNTKNQLREKEHERARTAGELADLRGSTIYKVGSVLTFVPRYLKSLLARFLNGVQQQS